MCDDKTNIQKNYSKIISNSVIIKQYVNGMSRFLILWIIKYHGTIHGYGILKELDKFFTIFVREGSLKVSNPSNIYPILNNMEKAGLIESELKMKNNKKLKYFKITDDGEYLLNYLYSRMRINHHDEQWKLFFEDMANSKF